MFDIFIFRSFFSGNFSDIKRVDRSFFNFLFLIGNLCRYYLVIPQNKIESFDRVYFVVRSDLLNSFVNLLTTRIVSDIASSVDLVSWLEIIYFY